MKSGLEARHRALFDRMLVLQMVSLRRVRQRSRAVQIERVTHTSAARSGIGGPTLRQRFVAAPFEYQTVADAVRSRKGWRQGGGNAADKAINLRAFILFFLSQGDQRDDLVIASNSLLKSEREFENASEVKEPIWMFGRMVHPQLVELTAFVAVAEQLSFTKAAVQVGSSLPTISQRIRSLEERLGVRLFNRTTRSVALTEAGERLFGEIKPIIDGLDHAIESVNFYRDKPIGALRLAVSRPAAIRQLAPLISPFLAEYPAIRLDVVVDDTDRDMVSGRFDAGIRVGRSIEQDMTILRLSDDPKMIVVAAPRYLESRPVPFVPKDLHGHNCIRFRWPWDGTMQPWIFRKGRENIEVRVRRLSHRQ
ncbi:LysR family transcriptional regulator [Bradyrhizobium sp. PUT101]|uniref:LysR family transcriptional regulator n=1 Tax=Bradyrhizobium sp. PUT101 TaxID=3447427 RepID=UPI003F85F010